MSPAERRVANPHAKEPRVPARRLEARWPRAMPTVAPHPRVASLARRPRMRRAHERAKSRRAANRWPSSRFTMSNSVVLLRSRGALLRPGCPCDSRPSPKNPKERGGRSADRRTISLSRLRDATDPHQRGAARPMTRDARLSALHRGDFRPGAALPSPALPPDPYSELLAARSSCLAGGVPDLPSPRLRAAAAGRHSPLRLQDRL